VSEKGKQPTNPPPPAPKRRLYRVSLGRVLYIVANDSVEAKELALKAEPNGAEVSCTGVSTASLQIIEADGWNGAFVYGTDVDEYAEDACRRLNS